MDPARCRPRTIEDICSVNGQRVRDPPLLSANMVPNYAEIRKVYDTFFAPGLDQLIETGNTKWFASRGFDLLTNDRVLLSQFMLYLTLVSTTPNTDPAVVVGPDQAALATHEARTVWALLNLVVHQAQEGGDEHAQVFARRVKALEALLTSEPVVRTSSMSDFLHQEPDEDVDMAGVPTVPNNPALEPTRFQKQLLSRSEEFWKLVEKASEQPTQIKSDLYAQTKLLLDGRENRDMVYSMMLLGGIAPPERENSGRRSGENSNNASPHRATHRQERFVAAKLLEDEVRRATNAVMQNVAGMALRAFVQ